MPRRIKQVSTNPKRKRTSLEKAFDSARLADMYLKGRSQREMIDTLSISRNTVQKALKELQQTWQSQALFDFNAAKAMQLAKVDHLEKVAWEGYHLSQQGKTSTTEMSTGRTSFTSETKSVSLAGDSKWLDKVQWCIDQRCKILGLHAPKAAIIHQTIEEKKSLDDMSTAALQRFVEQHAIPAEFDVSNGVEIGTEEGEIEQFAETA